MSHRESMKKKVLLKAAAQAWPADLLVFQTTATSYFMVSAATLDCVTQMQTDLKNGQYRSIQKSIPGCFQSAFLPYRQGLNQTLILFHYLRFL